jgi:hypothetical protein
MSYNRLPVSELREIRIILAGLWMECNGKVLLSDSFLVSEAHALVCDTIIVCYDGKDRAEHFVRDGHFAHMINLLKEIEGNPTLRAMVPKVLESL